MAPRAKKKTPQQAYVLSETGHIPDVEGAISMLDCLGSENDPVSVQLANGGWLELEDGLYGFDCGGRVSVRIRHPECPECTCTVDIDAGGCSTNFKIKYYAFEGGEVEGSLFDLVLDRMGITRKGAKS